MKDILITGGAGKIGYNLVLKLLDSKYNITVLDLKSKKSEKTLSKVADKIKIVYGDIEDKNLVMDLVKKNDIVVDYAGIMPPFANIDSSIANSTNYVGTKNIVDAILEVNPDCIYYYMSFISVYGTSDKKQRRITVDTESNHPEDPFSVSLIRSEDYIRSNLKKYVIMRMPIVLTKKNYFINHMAFDRRFDFIDTSDLNDIVIGLLRTKKSFGKTYNISGFKANSNIFYLNLYKSCGKLKYVINRDYYGDYDDFEEVEDIVKIKYTTANSYFKKLKDNTNPIIRIFRQLFYLPLYLKIKRDNK